MIIRAATTDDLPAIAALERDGFEPRDQWSMSAWSQELSGTDRQVAVADRDGAVVGVISVQLLPPASDLMRVVVSPAVRRQGVASHLIEHALDRAAADGATRMLLEVRHDNDAAIFCYGRAGFEQLTSRPDYYGAGVDALVMRAWDLQDRPTARPLTTPATGVDHG